MRRGWPTSSSAASVLPDTSQPDSFSLQCRRQGSSKPREEGPARVGSTRGEPKPHYPHPFCSFSPLAPSFSLSFVSWSPPIFRAGKKHERTSSSPPYQRRHHDLPSHPLNPKPLPWVLTPEGLEKRLTRKSALGSFLRCGTLLGGSCSLSIIGIIPLHLWPLILHVRKSGLERLVCWSPSQDWQSKHRDPAPRTLP